MHFISAQTDPPSHSFIHSFIRSCIHSLHSFIHLFIRSRCSFVCSWFSHSLIYPFLVVRLSRNPGVKFFDHSCITYVSVHQLSFVQLSVTQRFQWPPYLKYKMFATFFCWTRLSEHQIMHRSRFVACGPLLFASLLNAIWLVYKETGFVNNQRL